VPAAIPPRFRIGTAEPKDAVDAFTRRELLQPSFRWEDVYQEEHAASFAVAGVAQADILALFREGIDQALGDGGSLADFAKAIKPALVEKGWWGDIEITDPKTGEQRITRFNDARLRLIYDVNLRQSYAAGRWARAERTKASKPFIMYRTMRDERVRASHAAWDGVVLPIDHPFWNTHYAPNGWRCRCRCFAVSERDIQRYERDGVKIKRQAPPVVLTTFENQRTGEVSRVPVGIDPGFAYNPGKVRLQQLAQREARARLQAPTPPRPQFQEQSTAKAAAEWAVRNNLADRADYSGISPTVANAWNRSLFDHLQEYPALRAQQKFTGTAQVQLSLWRQGMVDRYVEKLRLYNPKADEATLRALAEKRFKAPRMGPQTWAHSMGQTDVSGIAVNRKWGADLVAFEKALKRNVETGFHPPGRDTIRSIVDHELGHQLDDLLALRKDAEILSAHAEALKLGMRQVVSDYAAKNVAEFIAECWAEALNNPQPRAMAMRVAAIIKARYAAKPPPGKAG
jgi:SPP1 gp7 family putative phage head morphogenesis protein